MGINHQKADVLNAMPGLWQRAIMDISAVSADIFNGKHQSCPSCGGKDRFRFDNNREVTGDGGFICSQCGSGTGLDLLMRMSGMQFSESINVLGDWLGQVPVEVRKAIAKEVKRDAGKEKYGSYVSPEICHTFMSKCSQVIRTPQTVCEGISPEPLVVYYRDGEIVATCFSLRLSGIDCHESELCDVAMVSSQGDVAFLSRGFPAGAVTIIPRQSDSTSVYLVNSWVDGYHTHHATSGAEVWICWSPENLGQVAHRCQGMDLRVACLADDADVLHFAEQAGLKVVVPRDGRWSRGLVKKLHDAADLISH